MILRLLPYSVADGPHNMAADEALLHAASEGQASLRFYSWSEATLSLGYFQPCQARFEVSRGRNPPDAWVRRPTGGATLVHHHELTYAIALPLTAAESPQGWMPRMHRIIADALPLGRDPDAFRLASKSDAWACGAGVPPAQFLCDRAGGTPAPQAPSNDRDTLCFKQPTVGDLLCGGHKILGSSQRKHHRCLLQHGALLLAQSPFTPTLPGLKELTGFEPNVDGLMGAIIEGFQRTTGWQVEGGEWRAEELALIERLGREKYSRPEWNEKR